VVEGEGEIVVRVVRASWRATFVHVDDTRRTVDGETLDVEIPHVAANVLRRRAELDTGWRLHLVELRRKDFQEFRAPVPDHVLHGDLAVADVWVAETYCGSIYGGSGDGWNAYLSFKTETGAPFEEGFYATRAEAAAAVAAGLLNGRRA
jgi:hypothetical protein